QSKSNDSGKTVHSAGSRENSERCFGQSKLGILAAYPDVTRRSKLTTTAQRKAIDGRDHRLFAILNSLKEPCVDTLEGLEFFARSNVANICARYKDLVAGTRQNQNAGMLRTIHFADGRC